MWCRDEDITGFTGKEGAKAAGTEQVVVAEYELAALFMCMKRSKN